jgi:hypothetical protein
VYLLLKCSIDTRHRRANIRTPGLVCGRVFGGDEDEEEFCVVPGRLELEEGWGGREGEIWDVGHGCGDPESIQ